jgi:hypothetical protein
MRRGLVTALAAATMLAVLIAPAAEGKRVKGVDVRPGCDFIDPSVCLYPWPNDAFTKRDKSTDTGRRLALRRGSTPRNKEGTPIGVEDINRADGFSPGAPLITKVPGLDSLAAGRRTKLPPLTDLSKSKRPKAPVVVINARTRKRHLIWAEVDSNPERPGDRVLIIRPAKNWVEGERYIVALRNLRTAGGREIEASKGFRFYRDRTRTRSRQVERRRRHFERIFRTLRRAGIERDSLYLAWDFTVASRDSLAGRMLHIRNDAFRGLGDRNLRDLQVQGAAPAFAVDTVTDFTTDQDPVIARRVEGTVTVPCYLTNACEPGGRFDLDRRGLPRRFGNYSARWYCNIPRSALAPGAAKARPALYGHGLLGSASRELNAGNVKAMSNEHNMVFCATDWIGFSGADIPNVIAVINDLSRFRELPDRMQQGFLNFLFLGRALIHSQGLNTHPAFGGVIDTRRLFFDGNSQGGIMGGALTAVAPDFDRAVLGVPGMNYSTLLQRSVDFDTYAPLLYGAYPNEIERQLQLALMQQLWDRSEANGYAQHMTSRPLPNTPAHQVLLHPAFGDHQVATLTAEVMARTIGARIYQPALDSGRSNERRPFYALPRIPRFPFAGSAFVMWDTGPLRTVNGEQLGTPPPPLTNTPPRVGEDPHSGPRNTENGRRQKSEFLKIGGRVIDVCGGRPCYAEGWTGP